MLEYEVFSLAELRENGDDDVLMLAVKEQLKSFRCSRSSWIQHFISRTVFEYEDAGWARTYVFLSPSDDGGILVPAFFSIGLTSFSREPNQDLSKTKANKLLGSRPNSRDGIVACFCLAELAREDSVSREDLPGSVILDEAKSVISSVQRQCGGRLVALDARPSIFEVLYEPAGFKKIGTRPSPNDTEEEDFVVAACKIGNW